MKENMNKTTEEIEALKSLIPNTIDRAFVAGFNYEGNMCDFETFCRKKSAEFCKMDNPDSDNTCEKCSECPYVEVMKYGEFRSR